MQVDIPPLTGQALRDLNPDEALANYQRRREIGDAGCRLVLNRRR